MRSFITSGIGLAAVLLAADGAGSAAVEAQAKKSIVPQGWKSKNDELSAFINAQASGKDGFEFPAFFSLCRKNGLPEDKVAHYESLVANKAENHGIEGRAKMTLRNMLATVARKNGKLVGLNDEETAISIAKPAVSGAAAKAQETAAAAAEETTTSDEQASDGSAGVVADTETTE